MPIKFNKNQLLKVIKQAAFDKIKDEARKSGLSAQITSEKIQIKGDSQRVEKFLKKLKT